MNNLETWMQNNYGPKCRGSIMRRPHQNYNTPEIGHDELSQQVASTAHTLLKLTFASCGIIAVSTVLLLSIFAVMIFAHLLGGG